MSEIVVCPQLFVFNGAVSGGIDGYYGASYPLDRVAANSVAGGISSVTHGGRFSDGLKPSLATSLLTYANVQMRAAMVAQSRLDPNNDGTGLSRGLIGDSFKLAGGRWNPYLLEGLTQCSPLGCRQNGPGSIFGMSYAKGGFVDMVAESFAGPHDRANAPWFYDPNGLIKDLRGMSAFSLFALEATTNYSTSLLLAAPFAFGAIAEQTHASAYLRDFRR